MNKKNLPIAGEARKVLHDQDTGPESAGQDKIAEIVSQLDIHTSGSRTGQPKVSSHNFEIIFNQDEVLSRLGLNAMSQRVSWETGYLPPWRDTKGIPLDFIQAGFLTEQDIVEIDQRVRAFMGDACSPSRIGQYRTLWAHRKAFYPLQDYILGLPMWDGTYRVDYAIPTVTEDEYTRAVFRNFFLSIIQRIFEPGCQVDSMMVLVGEQGCGKTSFFRSIFPCAPNELGEIPVTSQHKDDLISCHETAITIIDEIDKIKKRADQSNLKAFITRRVDRWRAPYARAECISPRSFVLCGTTNHLNFLQDSTGNRRYWPIKVEDRIPSYVLSRPWMDQCLAEAYQSYLEGDRVRWDAEFEAMAKLRQEEHTDAPIADLVDEFLANPIRVIRDAPPPPGGGDQPVELVDTSRVSARLFIDSIEELADVNIKRDRNIVAEIEDVLDTHPDYTRMEGQQRYSVDGRSVRVAWKKIK